MTTQTLSFLRRRFDEAGIRPHTKLGQNFLIDMNLQRVLLETARLTPEDVVLEVGTGTGGLTALLAQQAGAVVTVEVDRQLHQLAAEELFGIENVVMLQADALRNKNRLNPAIIEAVHAKLDEAPGRRFKLVANLPYNVATPIISNLLALDRPPQTMTCTVQKEVADRIVARPGTKDYGSLAIWVQSQCRAEIVRVLAPSVFWPRPKISSAFVQIELDPERLRRIPDRGFFHNFIRAIFMHRRKLLRSGLVALKQLDKPAVDRILADLGLEPNTRAEQLAPDAILALCETIRAAAGPIVEPSP